MHTYILSEMPENGQSNTVNEHVLPNRSKDKRFALQSSQLASVCLLAHLLPKSASCRKNSGFAKRYISRLAAHSFKSTC